MSNTANDTPMTAEEANALEDARGGHDRDGAPLTAIVAFEAGAVVVTLF